MFVRAPWLRLLALSRMGSAKSLVEAGAATAVKIVAEEVFGRSDTRVRGTIRAIGSREFLPSRIARE
jgi:hypothetical protein